MRVIALLLLGASLCAQAPKTARTWQNWLNSGIEDFQAGRYPEAAEAFRNALALAPNEATPHLYLGETWLAEYIPGAGSPENTALAKLAEAELQATLRIEPNDETAIVSLASLKYQQAQGQLDPDQKLQMLDEAASWYERAIAANPQNKEAHYSLGVIGWSKWYPALMAVRSEVGMTSAQQGPLVDPVARKGLRERYALVLEQAVSNLEKALELDPMYDDAMAYMNLLVRERADLDETPEQYASDIRDADQWIQKALDTKRMRAAAAERQGLVASRPRRIYVGGKVQEAKVIRRVDPVYPAELGVDAQGTVRLAAIIGTDGHIQDLRLISGQPSLVKAAMDAVRQWEYTPALLNGELVEVETEIAVNVRP